MRIGMFDSGVGILTVLKSFIKYHPNNEYFYYGDTLNVPYGDKTKEELLELSKKIIKYLENKKVDIIIIACGTISSNVYDDLTKITNIPIYSIIKETINYALDRKYNKILLIATSATVNSHIFKKNIPNLIEMSCPKLVPLIESRKKEELNLVLKEYFKDIKEIDAIILGCTHYPIIKEEIKNILNTSIIDMGEILAQKIKTIDTFQSIDLYFSKTDEKVKENIKMILGDIC